MADSNAEDAGQEASRSGDAGDGRERAAGARDVGAVVGVTPIPASIVHAVCAIKATLEAVKKTQRNAHGGYMFASTDDIYAALARKMGEVGLAILALEDTAEIKRFEKDGKTVQWLHAVYQFVLATSGDTWSDPRARRTVYVQITGPQTFQAAQSYAEKSYLRSLFSLPTGDMDLDAMPQAETEEGQLALTGQGAKRKSSSAAKKDGTSEVFATIRRAIQQAATADLLDQIPDLYAEEIATLPRAWNEIIQSEYEDRMMVLRS